MKLRGQLHSEILVQVFVGSLQDCRYMQDSIPLFGFILYIIVYLVANLNTRSSTVSNRCKYNTLRSLDHEYIGTA